MSAYKSYWFIFSAFFVVIEAACDTSNSWFQVEQQCLKAFSTAAWTRWQAAGLCRSLGANVHLVSLHTEAEFSALATALDPDPHQELWVSYELYRLENGSARQVWADGSLVTQNVSASSWVDFGGGDVEPFARWRTQLDALWDIRPYRLYGALCAHPANESIVARRVPDLLVLNSTMTWLEAQQACAARDMVIADARDGHEASAIRNATNSDGWDESVGIWLGRHSLEADDSGYAVWLTEGGYSSHLSASVAVSDGGFLFTGPVCAALNTSGFAQLAVPADCFAAKVAVCASLPERYSSNGLRKCPLGWIYSAARESCLRMVKRHTKLLGAVASCARQGGSLSRLAPADGTYENSIFTQHFTTSSSADAIWSNIALMDRGTGGEWVDFVDLSDPNPLSIADASSLGGQWHVSVRTNSSLPTELSEDVINAAPGQSQFAHAVCERPAAGELKQHKLCPEGWLHYFGSCMRPSTWNAAEDDRVATFEDADAACVASGGTSLLEIRWELEAEFAAAIIQATMPAAAAMWLGIDPSSEQWHASNASCAATGIRCPASSICVCTAPFAAANAAAFNLTDAAFGQSTALKSTRLPYICQLQPSRMCDGGHLYLDGKCFVSHTNTQSLLYHNADGECRALSTRSTASIGAATSFLTHSVLLQWLQEPGWGTNRWFGMETFNDQHVWHYSNGAPYAPSFNPFLPSFPSNRMVAGEPARLVTDNVTYARRTGNEHGLSIETTSMQGHTLCEYVPVPERFVNRCADASVDFRGTSFGQFCIHAKAMTRPAARFDAARQECALLNGGSRLALPTGYGYYLAAAQFMFDENVPFFVGLQRWDMSTPDSLDVWLTEDGEPARVTYFAWSQPGYGTETIIGIESNSEGAGYHDFGAGVQFRQLCESPIVPRCQSGWIYSRTVNGPGATASERCIKVLTGSVWSLGAAMGSCRAAHSRSHVFVPNSPWEVLYVVGGVARDALAAAPVKDMWLGLQRATLFQPVWAGADGGEMTAQEIANAALWQADPQTAAGIVQDCLKIVSATLAIDTVPCTGQPLAVMCEMPVLIPSASVGHGLLVALPLPIVPASPTEAVLSPARAASQPTLRSVEACSEGWHRNISLSMCYRLEPLSSPAAYAEAFIACDEAGGRLAQPASAQELAGVASLMQLSQGAGAFDGTLRPRAWLGVGDWDEEGLYRTLSGRVLKHQGSNSESAADTELDVSENTGVADCLQFELQTGSTLRLVPAACHSQAAAWALCEQPLLTLGGNAYFPQLARSSFQGAVETCAELDAYPMYPATPAAAEYTARIAGGSGPQLRDWWLGMTGDWRGPMRTVHGVAAHRAHLAVQGGVEALLPAAHAGCFVGLNGTFPEVTNAPCCSKRGVICERSVERACPFGWVFRSDYCWQRRDVASVSLPLAVAACALDAAVLASPQSAVDLQWLAHTMLGPGTDEAVVGMAAPGGQWGWMDGNNFEPPADVWLHGRIPEANYTGNAALLQFRPPAGSDGPSFFLKKTEARTLKGARRAQKQHSLEPSSAICQRPAHQRTFRMCTRGWLPMWDRCWFFSARGIGDLSWTLADFPAVTKEHSVAANTCSAMGGTNLAAPATELHAALAKHVWRLFQPEAPAISEGLWTGAIANTVTGTWNHPLFMSRDLCSGSAWSTLADGLVCSTPPSASSSIALMHRALPAVLQVVASPAAKPLAWVCEQVISDPAPNSVYTPCGASGVVIAGVCHSVIAMPPASGGWWSARALCSGLPGRASLASLMNHQQTEWLAGVSELLGHTNSSAQWVGVTSIYSRPIFNFAGSPIVEVGSRQGSIRHNEHYFILIGHNVSAGDYPDAVPLALCTAPIKASFMGTCPSGTDAWLGSCYSATSSAASATASRVACLQAGADMWSRSSWAESWLLKDTGGIAAGTATALTPGWFGSSSAGVPAARWAGRDSYYQMDGSSVLSPNLWQGSSGLTHPASNALDPAVVGHPSNQFAFQAVTATTSARGYCEAAAPTVRTCRDPGDTLLMGWCVHFENNTATLRGECSSPEHIPVPLRGHRVFSAAEALLDFQAAGFINAGLFRVGSLNLFRWSDSLIGLGGPLEPTDLNWGSSQPAGTGTGDCVAASASESGRWVVITCAAVNLVTMCGRPPLLPHRGTSGHAFFSDPLAVPVPAARPSTLPSEVTQCAASALPTPVSGATPPVQTAPATGTPTASATSSATPSVTATSSCTASVSPSVSPAMTPSPSPSPPACPPLPTIQGGVWLCTSAQGAVHSPDRPALDTICSASCSSSAFHLWGFGAMRCLASSLWGVLLSTSPAKHVAVAPAAQLEFPAVPLCAPLAPLAPAALSQIDTCQLTARGEYRGELPTVQRPVTTWGQLRADPAWAWIGAHPAGVDEQLAASAPAAVPGQVGAAGPPPQNQSAARDHLAAQWSTIAQAHAAATEYLTVHVLHATHGVSSPPLAPSDAANFTLVGVAGDAAAYTAATGAVLPGQLWPTVEVNGADEIPRNLQLRDLQEGVLSWVYFAAGNGLGLSALSPPSPPFTAFTSKCDLLSISPNTQLTAFSAHTGKVGPYAMPAVMGASSASAFSAHTSASVQSSGAITATDSRLGARPAVFDKLSTPSQPIAPSAVSPLLVSDISTPAGIGFSIFLPKRPAAGERVRVTCAADPRDAASISPAVNNFDASAPEFRQWVMAVPSSPTLTSAQASGHAGMAAWTGSLHAVICSVQSSGVPASSAVYAGLPPISMPLRRVPVAHPFIGDILLQLPAGEWQSMWPKSQSGATGYLLSPAASFVSDSYAQLRRAANAPVVYASDSTAVTREGADSFTRFQGHAPQNPSQLMSLTLGGKQNITIMADCSQRVTCIPASGPMGPADDSRSTRPLQVFAFAPGVQVWFGDVQLEVLAVSSDGLAISARTPSFTDLCPTAAACVGQRAYRTIWVANPPLIPPDWVLHVEFTWAARAAGNQAPDGDWVQAGTPLFSLGESAWSQAATTSLVVQQGESVGAAVQVLGGATACPHACPGAAGQVAADDQGSSGSRQLQAAIQPTFSQISYGVFVTSLCVGYLPPGPVCLDPTTAQGCAFGGGDECEPCGAGAVCPGGRRRWPLPGHWSDNEGSRAGVRACQPPARERCLGWNNTLARAQCGVGYTGTQCALCSEGYFPEDSGECSTCPPQDGGLEIVLPLLMFAGSAAVLFLIMALAIRAAVAVRGGSFGGGLKRAAQFVIWTVSMLQVIVQVGKAASPGLPDFLQSMYRQLNVLQFDTSGLVHPACSGGAAFLSESISMGLALSLLVLAVLLTAFKAAKVGVKGHDNPLLRAGASGDSNADAPVAKPKPKAAIADTVAPLDPRAATGWWGRAKPWLRRGSFTLMTLMYALVCNTVLGLLHCEETPVDDGSGGVQMKWLLVSNPFYECFAGAHQAPGALAVIMLIVYVIGYPLATYFWVRRKIHKVLSKSLAAVRYRTAADKVSAVRKARRALRAKAQHSISVNSEAGSVLSIAMDKGVAVQRSSARRSLGWLGGSAGALIARAVPLGAAEYDSDEEALLAQHLQLQQTELRKGAPTAPTRGAARKLRAAKSKLLRPTSGKSSVLDRPTSPGGGAQLAGNRARTRSVFVPAAAQSTAGGTGAGEARQSIHVATTSVAQGSNDAKAQPGVTAGQLNPMFTRVVPAFKAQNAVLLHARRLGARSALAAGQFTNVMRYRHLLVPAETSHSAKDAGMVRSADEANSMALYRDSVLKTSFGSMQAVQARALILRAGIAIGQGVEPDTRTDEHAEHLRRTQMHPALSHPSFLSSFSARQFAGNPAARPPAVVARIQQHHAALQPAADLPRGCAGAVCCRACGGGAASGADTGGAEQSTLSATNPMAILSHGRTVSPVDASYRERQGSSSSIGEQHAPRAVCMFNACFYAFCCCLCAVPCVIARAKLCRCVRGCSLHWKHRNDAASPEEAVLRKLLDSSPALVQNTTLAHFLDNDYKVTHFYFRHLYLLVLATLSVTIVFFAAPDNVGQAVLKMLLTLGVLLSVALSNWYTSPFVDTDKWKENAKIFSLLLAALSGVLNFITWRELKADLEVVSYDAASNLQPSIMVEAMAILVFVLSVLLFVVLAVSFWRVLLAGATAEARALARRRRMLHRSVRDLPNQQQLSYQPGGNPLLYKSLSDRMGAAGSSQLLATSPQLLPAAHSRLSSNEGATPSQLVTSSPFLQPMSGRARVSPHSAAGGGWPVPGQRSPRRGSASPSQYTNPMSILPALHLDSMRAGRSDSQVARPEPARAAVRSRRIISGASAHKAAPQQLAVPNGYSFEPPAALTHNGKTHCVMFGSGGGGGGEHADAAQAPQAPGRLQAVYASMAASAKGTVRKARTGSKRRMGKGLSSRNML